MGQLTARLRCKRGACSPAAAGTCRNRRFTLSRWASSLICLKHLRILVVVG